MMGTYLPETCREVEITTLRSSVDRIGFVWGWRGGGNGKVLVLTLKAYEGVQMQLHPLLTSLLGRCGWSSSTPVLLTLKEVATKYPFSRLSGAQNQSGHLA